MSQKNVLGRDNGKVTEAGSMLPIMKIIILGWKKEHKGQSREENKSRVRESVRA